jgi:hypothetical protein
MPELATITISLDNDAFDESDCVHELARILETLAGRLREDGMQEFPLRDINGNTVGKLKFS